MIHYKSKHAEKIAKYQKEKIDKIKQETAKEIIDLFNTFFSLTMTIDGVEVNYPQDIIDAVKEKYGV